MSNVILILMAVYGVFMFFVFKYLSMTDSIHVEARQRAGIVSALFFIALCILLLTWRTT